jgi:hypothetical protein
MNDPAGAVSLTDRLRARRAANLRKPKHHDIALPGYEGLMVVRYRPLEWEHVQEIFEASADPELALETNVDTLIRACDRIMVLVDGELVSLADRLREQGEHVNTESGEVRFDHKLVEVLGLELEQPADPRDIVLASFEAAVSPELAVWEQAQELGAWMGTVAREVDSELGKDSAATRDSSSPPPPTHEASTAATPS